MPQSEIEKLYEYLEGAKVEAEKHTCEYTRTVGDNTYRCQTKAIGEWKGFWYCDAHLAWYQLRPDLRQIRFRIVEAPCAVLLSVNTTNVQRLTVNGRPKKRG